MWTNRIATLVWNAAAGCAGASFAVLWLGAVDAPVDVPNERVAATTEAPLDRPGIEPERPPGEDLRGIAARLAALEQQLAPTAESSAASTPAPASRPASPPSAPARSDEDVRTLLRDQVGSGWYDAEVGRLEDRIESAVLAFGGESELEALDCTSTGCQLTVLVEPVHGDALQTDLGTLEGLEGRILYTFEHTLEDGRILAEVFAADGGTR